MNKIYSNWQYSQHLTTYTSYEETLLQLFYGARWDGDLINKTQIGIAVKKGHVVRTNGFSLITKEGCEYLIEIGAVLQ